MLRKLQIMIAEDNWRTVESIFKEANLDFKCGNINYSDIINEMISIAKVDIRSLQAKNINVRKSLRSLASQKEIDLDGVIKFLTDFKNKSGRRAPKGSSVTEGSPSGN